MADFATYWKFYPAEHCEPTGCWLSNREWWVAQMEQGDRLWLFIGGDSCGQVPHQAYIARLLIVESAEDNAECDQDGFKYIININRSVPIEPPILVDDILRQSHIDAMMHIGNARQTPIVMSGVMTNELLARLREQRPDILAACT